MNTFAEDDPATRIRSQRHGDLARLPAVYRNAGGGPMSRIAAAGILRLALRWPALTVVLVLSVVAGRFMSSRRHQPDDIRPAPRAP